MSEKDYVDFDAGELLAGTSVPLAHPFKFQSTIYKTCELRAPTGADVELHFKGVDYLKETKALAVALSGWTDAVFDRMHAADRGSILTAVGECVAGVR